MDKLGTYVYSLTAAALLCGVLKALVKEKSCAGALEFAASLFLLVVSLQPWTGELRLPDLTALAQVREEAEAVAREGEEEMLDSLAQGIADQTATYIEDKAASLGATVTAEVTTRVESGWPVPAQVYITGNVSPSVKGQLADYMEQTLAIDGEAQFWNQ